MILAAFLRNGVSESPMTMEEVVTYIWLSQALILFLPWRGDPEIQELIRSGNVAYELVKPIDLYGLWFARSVAMRTSNCPD